MLQEVGVVDAGGMGIVAIIGGALGHLLGWNSSQLDREIPAWRTASARPNSVEVDPHYLDSTRGSGWGYCIQYVVEGREMKLERILEQLEAMGDSTVVVGTEELLRVHIHAADPGLTLSYGVSLGQLSQINIQNMSQQNEEFVTDHRSDVSRHDSKKSHRLAEEVSEGMAVVAVVSGEGMAQLFREAGCAAVISGGEEMNPSVPQLLDAVQRAGVKDVIILPNSNNVPAAEQAAQGETWGRNLHVVPSRNLPKGVAALLAFNPEETLEHNLKVMLKGDEGNPRHCEDDRSDESCECHRCGRSPGRRRSIHGAAGRCGNRGGGRAGTGFQVRPEPIGAVERADRDSVLGR